MLLFILIRENFASLYVCFNTSHVTLYRGMASTNGMERYVSIHLMLLFIYILPRNHLRMSVFQYISCYSLSSPFPPNLLYSKLVSIHLMLLFIGYTSKDSRRSRRVSIHLMLLFIFFSTSLANVLAVSIHLMLLFITSSQNIYYQYNPFQYISCYSLSGILTWSVFVSGGFNTSHVTLYQ